MNAFFRWTSPSNIMEMIDDGDAMFRCLWQATEAARKRVWIEVYIFKEDRVGRRTLELLQKASERGCEVSLLYDSFGFLPETDDTFETLRSSGAEVYAYNPVWPLTRNLAQGGVSRSPGSQENMIIDDFGLIGGLNISEEYAGKELGIAYFADTMPGIRGPAVRHLAEVFFESLPEKAGKGRQLPETSSPEVKNTIQVLKLDAGTDNSRALSLALSPPSAAPGGSV